MIKHLTGTVKPPADMLKAARDSLAEFPGAFEDLMEQTGGNVPTAEQLCAMCDSCRQARLTAETNEIMPSFTAQIVGTSDTTTTH